MTLSPDPARPTPARMGRGWRDLAWERLSEGPFDVLVVGGGITGAGIARRAAQAGLRTALVEKGDLAAGTSAWSSKLVHGGLRYLAHLQVGVVRQSVHGREALLRAAPGLVEELGFLMPVPRGSSPGAAAMAVGLAAYDLLGRRRTHQCLRDGELELLAPRVRSADLAAAFRYGDAWTDDARLVFRVAMDAATAGAVVLTYAEVEELLRGSTGDVTGVRVADRFPGAGHRSADVRATALVNATGVWADRIRAPVGGAARLRPLRGSHLLFPAWRFPGAQAVSYPHPFDGRRSSPTRGSRSRWSGPPTSTIPTTRMPAPGSRPPRPTTSWRGRATSFHRSTCRRPTPTPPSPVSALSSGRGRRTHPPNPATMPAGRRPDCSR
jgi:glycerol-3-phosphate dehydrogenase